MTVSLSKSDDGWSGTIHTTDKKTVQVIKVPSMSEAVLMVDEPESKDFTLSLLTKADAQSLVTLLTHYINDTEPERSV